MENKTSSQCNSNSYPEIKKTIDDHYNHKPCPKCNTTDYLTLHSYLAERFPLCYRVYCRNCDYGVRLALSKQASTESEGERLALEIWDNCVEVENNSLLMEQPTHTFYYQLSLFDDDFDNASGW